MHIEKKTLRYILLGAISCIVLYWILIETEKAKAAYQVVAKVLSPFAIGACIAFILNVPMRAFERLLKGVKNDQLRRIIAIILTFICLAIVLTAVFMLLIPQLVGAISDLTNSIPRFVEEISVMTTEFINENYETIEWIQQNAKIEDLNWAGIAKQGVGIAGNVLSSLVTSLIAMIIGLFGALFNALIAIVFAIYCLFQKETLARQGRKILYAFLDEKKADGFVHVLRLTNTTFSNFLSGQCIEVCILGAMFAITMAIFRMPYIPLVSVLIAVTAFIPIVGAWIGCVVGAFLMFVNDPTSLQPIWFVILSVVVQQVENNVIYPRVVGTSIGLSGMWVLLAVAVGGQLMGVVGMFLMIPMVSVIYTVLREITNKKLSTMEVDSQKLECQPPDIISKFTDKPIFPAFLKKLLKKKTKK